MCELFAMSARLPTWVRLSLDELARHGGETGPHRDGWGIAFVQDGDAQVVREPEVASESACLAFLREHERPSTMILAHIRKATQGGRLLRNTQPFVRELGGRAHLFAHNGMLRGIEQDARFVATRFQPIGETDSERAFCVLLDRIAALQEGARSLPSLEHRLAVVAAFAADARSLGPANFLYADGDVLFAHGDRRTNAAGVVTAPGLHMLCRSCTASDHVAPELVGMSIAPEHEQEVALVASVPLSDEAWQPLREGEVVVLGGGRLIARR